ncbi:hypothetical protein C1H46_001567 [Malus baccata]|uniref:26S proteasome regulatory subunit RPN11 C-terminal domain-containing protein n=1 Tax=Malus baccata TaxID=106549 RepID=A0A540NPF9_MALBA|nr:hypothetical protein C1H46_001567 [Malus baccata]
MLLNLGRKNWTAGLKLRPFDHRSETNLQAVQEMLNIAAEYKKAEKDELPPVKLATAKVGKQAANKHLEQLASNFKSSDIGWTFGTC